MREVKEAIVYARRYLTHGQAAEQMDAFAAFAAAKEMEASAWQTMTETDPPTYEIVVVDESAEMESLTFDWQGDPLDLPIEVVAAFIGRREEQLAAEQARTGRIAVDQRLRWPGGNGPRLVNGEWVTHFDDA